MLKAYKSEWSRAKREMIYADPASHAQYLARIRGLRKKRYDHSPEYRREVIDRAKAWRKAHPEQAQRQRMREREQVRHQTFQAYGGKCSCCGEAEHFFLEIDHINGGGNKHRKQLRLTGVEFYRWLRRNGFPEGYRVLCANCHVAISRFGDCPHNR